jgi:hypothetical protein
MIQTTDYDDFLNYLAIAFYSDYGINIYANIQILPYTQGDEPANYNPDDTKI